MAAKPNKEKRPRKGRILGIHYSDPAEVEAIEKQADRFRYTPSQFGKIAIEIGIRTIKADPTVMWQSES